MRRSLSTAPPSAACISTRLPCRTTILTTPTSAFMQTGDSCAWTTRATAESDAVLRRTGSPPWAAQPRRPTPHSSLTCRVRSLTTCWPFFLAILTSSTPWRRASRGAAARRTTARAAAWMSPLARAVSRELSRRRGRATRCGSLPVCTSSRRSWRCLCRCSWSGRWLGQAAPTRRRRCCRPRSMCCCARARRRASAASPFAGWARGSATQMPSSLQRRGPCRWRGAASPAAVGRGTRPTRCAPLRAHPPRASHLSSGRSCRRRHRCRRRRRTTCGCRRTRRSPRTRETREATSSRSAACGWGRRRACCCVAASSRARSARASRCTAASSRRSATRSRSPHEGQTSSPTAAESG
mmetsp:Transcript_22117/g.70668  ORF Transcript_22117/g.70668 Transcript_22117/m.70668 type:complete len:353 (+) Transcript_22117:266-1324(+)